MPFGILMLAWGLPASDVRGSPSRLLGSACVVEAKLVRTSHVTDVLQASRGPIADAD